MRIIERNCSYLQENWYLTYYCSKWRSKQANAKKDSITGSNRLSDGEIKDPDNIIFDAFIEEGARLELSIGGTEFD